VRGLIVQRAADTVPRAMKDDPSAHAATGPILLVVTAVLWSLSGVLVKSTDWNPLAISGVRSAFAIPVMLFFTGRPRVTFSAAQIGAAIAYSGTMIFFVLATRMTSAANAIFLQYTAPIYVAVVSHWWLKERGLRSDWITIPVALAGIALFFLDRLSVSGLWGNLFGLLSGVSFAATAIFLRQERAASPATALLMGNILTSLVTAPVIFTGPFPWPELPKLLFLGTVQLGLSYGLYSVAIKRVTALEATLLPLLEPVLNPIWVMLAIGEVPGKWALIGGSIVLLAVIFRGAVMVISRQRATA
jgi:drug/metabolite transporter (DMT)-like permease